MWTWIQKYVWGGIVAVIAVLALLLGIQTAKNKKLKAEVDGAEKTAEKATEQLETVNAAIQKAEEKRKEVLNTEATLDNIKKETVEAVKSAQEIKKTDTVTFGKWVLIFAVLFAASGCGATLEKCRIAYPCPNNICVAVTPPALDKLPRPDLTELAVKYDEVAKGFVLTPEQIGSLLGNERALVETIKGYEKIIDVYNDWRLKQ